LLCLSFSSIHFILSTQFPSQSAFFIYFYILRFSLLSFLLWMSPPPPFPPFVFLYLCFCPHFIVLSFGLYFFSSFCCHKCFSFHTLLAIYWFLSLLIFRFILFLNNFPLPQPTTEPPTFQTN
jgi:hypothetical protein